MLALLVLCDPALARDNGQYNSVAPEVRQWFRAQKSPKTGGLCCNEADGTYAEEDIRTGVYWTRFDSTPPKANGFPSPRTWSSKTLAAMALPLLGGTSKTTRC
jgi:hypothetical protein